MCVSFNNSSTVLSSVSIGSSTIISTVPGFIYHLFLGLISYSPFVTMGMIRDLVFFAKWNPPFLNEFIFPVTVLVPSGKITI